jgi:hypothetical protein
VCPNCFLQFSDTSGLNLGLIEMTSELKMAHVENVITYSIASRKWLCNIEPSGPGILYKGSNSGMTRNMFKDQISPLASKRKRTTAASLTITVTTSRKAFHPLKIDMDRGSANPD